MSYRSPLWLPGGHAQTMVPALLTRRPHVAYHRTRWHTPDGDFIELDWTENPELIHQNFSPLTQTPPRPLIVLFHGLEGSSNSHYARALMQHCMQRQWLGVVVHFRGCSGVPNVLPRAYHSGDSAEIDWVLRRLQQENPAHTLYAVGVSLGGNALLKWLGEQGHAAEFIRAAAAISAPLDLAASAESLRHGINLLYTREFLRTLIPKTLNKLEQFPGLVDATRVRCSKNFHDFDEYATAPLHGFSSAQAYWKSSASKPWLRHITVPTLVLNAKNDPFLPAKYLPTSNDVASAVTLEQPTQGGHVGFLTGWPWGRLDWLPERICQFLCGAQ